ncbi:MAG: hypothetical protein Q8R82_11585 [Hyphomonadaceae bacterium]|nr:hypothetical protein [Hyphomonadaceae bacterium]
MAGKAAATILFASILAACSPQPPVATAPEATPTPVVEQQGNTPPEDLDPFIVMIGAERWTVILEKALEGAREAPQGPRAAEETDLYRADSALKSGAAMVIELRNRVCRKGLVSGEACTLPEWPAWTHEPPTGDTPIEEIDRRSGWLDTVMAPFTAAGCEAGRKAMSDDMFCSVE